MRNGTGRAERLPTAPTFHSRAIKMASSRKIQKPHFEQAPTYRNQILGIERIMNDRLKENDELYNGSLDNKREILLDALEDVSNANLGFHEQLRRVISTWRKPYDRVKTKKKTTDDGLKDYYTVMEQLRNLQSQLQEEQNLTGSIKEQIEFTAKTISSLEAQIEDETRTLFRESDIFARERQTSDVVLSLQKQFDALFTVTKEEEFPECAQLAKENEALRRELMKKKCELDIALQITKRLSIITKVTFD